jgi:signal transduction histidine kinase
MTSSATAQASGFEAILPERSPFRIIFSWEPIKAFLFLVLTFAIWIVIFSTLVTLIALAVGLTLSIILAVVGIPLFALTLLLMPVIGHVERFRVRLLTGIDIPNPYKKITDELWGDKAKAFLTDGALWRDLLYAIVIFPIGVVEFVIAVVGVSVPLSLLSIPIILQFNDEIQVTGFWSVASTAESFVLAGIGIVLLLLAAYLFVILARAHGIFARWLIGPSDVEALAARVETLSESRSRMVGVSLEDRRHIERDIHDSTQPRLVSLAMTLGMAREKLDTDPDGARALIDSAHQQAKEVLVEIRNLVRGLHPSILTDRGLEAAVPALAGQCAVPVAVSVELDDRPSEAVETTAYYIVAEALTNVAKHSRATEAHVIIQRDNGNLRIDIVDVGVGGASPSPGSGLSGLSDRVDALDGSLEISSPEGGPTRISARLPCES